MMKILHFLDSSQNTNGQFAAYVLNQFCAIELSSDFVVLSPNPGAIVPDSLDRVRIINPNDHVIMSALLDSMSCYSGIVLHGLFNPWCEVVLDRIPKHVKVAWMFWGGEVYYDKNRFLAPVTKVIYDFRRRVKNKRESVWHLPIHLYQRIDYCLTGVQEEFEYVKQWAQAEQMRHIWYTYYSIEDTVGELMASRCNGQNVWICNSAAVENNVYDVVAAMMSPSNRKLLKNRTVIMPLSYGTKWVRNSMLRIGPKVFPGGFTPLLDFLPRPEYNRLMLSCSTMILFYYRPAGQGNIITALWLGMRVYLSEKSMIFTFFKRLGIVIFAFESDFSQFGCEKLLDEDIQNNRRILLEYYGRKHIDDACMDVVKALA